VKKLFRLTCLVVCWGVIFWVAGCGKKAEEPATAEETAAAETAAPESPPEDFNAAFEAKVAEADGYMTAHDVKNTRRKEIADTLEGFQRDFEDLAAKAAGEPELSARCALAAEGMALYVKSLRMPQDDLEQMQVAIDAEVKWTQAKEGPASLPQE
jgi:hypothetical protein